MYPMETPEPKWINQAHLYEINYVLLPRGEDQTVTNPSLEIYKKKKNWLFHNIGLLGMVLLLL